jgi:hypothetical protein
MLQLSIYCTHRNQETVVQFYQYFVTLTRFHCIELLRRAELCKWNNKEGIHNRDRRRLSCENTWQPRYRQPWIQRTLTSFRSFSAAVILPSDAAVAEYMAWSFQLHVVRLTDVTHRILVVVPFTFTSLSYAGLRPNN